MTFRATRITIHNETKYSLTLTNSTVDGEWTEKWGPPETVGAFTTASMRSENAEVLTGTGGSVTYAVEQQGEPLWIHWKNPAVGLAFYEQNSPGTLGVFFEGGKGDEAVAHYYLIPSRKVVVEGYLPSSHGFRFYNDWPPYAVITAPLVPLSVVGNVPQITVSDASQGLCGGMSAASMDYFQHDEWSPATQNAPQPGDPLLDYIIRRQKSTLLEDPDASVPIPNAGALNFITYGNPVYPHTDDMFMGLGRNWVTARVAWPEIRRRIDAGQLVMLGALMGDWGSVVAGEDYGHQVVAYGYRMSGNVLTLWVYDPNNPYREFDPATAEKGTLPRADGSSPGKAVFADDTRIEIDLSRTDQHAFSYGMDPEIGHPPIRVLFVMDYQTKQAPQGRPPELWVKLTEARTATGSPTRISSTTLRFREGCMKGEYPVGVDGQAERRTITATMSPRQAPLEWRVNGTPVPNGLAGAMLDVKGKMAIVQVASNGKVEESSAPVQGIVAQAFGTTLTLDIPPMGRFELKVTAHPSDPADPKADEGKLTIWVDNLRVAHDPSYIAQLRRCAGADDHAAPEMESPISDPPWHDIFGPGFPEGPPIPIGAIPELSLHSAIERERQVSAILARIATRPASPARDQLAHEVAWAFGWTRGQ